ncbi:hypothetical protein [Corynebacterium sp.]|uniref:hypothetical protein n=1 Tax=Corynebacterium sp. TaxID=1720 RepID=UPI0026E0FA8A|nr:hypothetical protein [Corynebacterium sp.]MDO5512793.1 hypothetical protein [Corynebacterium sp.]
MNQFDAINAALQLISLPEDRALAQRWFLRFLVANPRFNALQTAEIALQVRCRWGMDVIRDSIDEDWITRPLPATRAEWEADGYRVPREARPLLITGDDGRQQELYLLFDVDLVREDLVGAIDHEPERALAAVGDQPPALGQFALHLGERERRAFGELWKVCTVLDWADVAADEERVYLGPLGWIETVSAPNGCHPHQTLRTEEACYCLRIHPDAEGPEIVDLGLSLTAQLLTTWTQGRRAGETSCGHDEAQITDLEIGIVTWVVGKRLGFGAHHANVDTFRFIENHSDFPAPSEVDWGRIVETVGIMEDLLTGVMNPALPRPGEQRRLTDAVAGLSHDPYGVVGRELAMLKAEGDGEIAERWVLDFVAENPRFPLGTALALGWQLYRRWGDSVAGDAHHLDWIGNVNVRTIEDWALRGRVPRPEARLLVAPGTHGQEIYYLLHDDAIIADRLTDLQTRGVEHPSGLPFRAGPSDAAALDEFDGLVTPREKEMLRNLWRGRITPVIVTDPEVETEASLNRNAPPYWLPVTVEDGVNPMRAIIESIATWVLAWELGVMHTAPVVRGRYWVASPWESALVTHLVMCRLEIDCERSHLVEEALARTETVPGLIRWGLVYHAASETEDMLRGYPAGPPVLI